MSKTQEPNNCDDQAAIALFCETLTRLNAISKSHMQDIVEIATAVAAAAQAFSGAGATQKDLIEKTGKLIEDLKQKVSSLHQEVASAANAKPEAAGETIAQAVERGIDIAIANSVSNQQQLNVIGAAVVTQGAALILSLAGHRDATTS